jgi:hypothetical protein
MLNRLRLFKEDEAKVAHEIEENASSKEQGVLTDASLGSRQ